MMAAPDAWWMCWYLPTHETAIFRAACATRDEHAARRMAISKRMRHPSTDLAPFALETGGRLGVDARAFANRMASASEDPAAERQCLHRAIQGHFERAAGRRRPAMAEGHIISRPLFLRGSLRLTECGYAFVPPFLFVCWHVSLTLARTPSCLCADSFASLCRHYVVLFHAYCAV